MTEAQIKHMANRFLGWKLPEDFHPDAGISFKAEFNEHTPRPMKHQPTGTNLLDAAQAEAMIRYLALEMPNAYLSVSSKIEALGEALFVLSGRLPDARFFEGKGNGDAYNAVVEAFERLRDAVRAGGVQ